EDRARGDPGPAGHVQRAAQAVAARGSRRHGGLPRLRGLRHDDRAGAGGRRRNDHARLTARPPMSGPFFYGAPIACFLFARHFREAPRWRSLAGYDLGTGIVVKSGTSLCPVAIDNTSGGLWLRAPHRTQPWESRGTTRLGR